MIGSRQVVFVSFRRGFRIVPTWFSYRSDKGTKLNQAKSTDNSAATRGGSFTTGSIQHHILRISGVMILGFLAMTVGGLIEMFYLGMVGSVELAAITFTFPIAMSLNAMTRGIGIGGSSLIAQALARGGHLHIFWEKVDT